MSEQTGLPSPEELAEFIKTAETAASEALEQGNHESAAKLFNEILGIVPSNPVAHNGIGLIAVSNDHANVAEHHFRKAIAHAPDWPDPHLHLGLLLLHGGRARRALKMFNRVLELSPEQTGVRYFLAQALQKQGKKEAHEEELRKILKDMPDHGPACNDLGIIEAQRSHFEAAVDLFRRAAESADPVDGARINQGNVQLLMDDNTGAERTFELALEATPNSIDALTGKATALRRQGKLDEALLTAERAVSLAPENTRAKNAAGTIYRELGIFDAAETHFTDALQADPEQAAPRSNLALLRLMQGDWERAWPDYEARTRVPGFTMSWGKAPLRFWDGSDISNKSIIVFSEQGFGDSIQFARFLPELAKLSKKTLFAVQPELVPLMQSLQGDISFVTPNTPLPEIDAQALLLSLPGLMGINQPSMISGAPYLTAPEPSKALAGALNGIDGFKVGINWRGATRHSEDFKRSLDIDMIEPLLITKGATFISLDFSKAEDDTLDGIIDLSAHVSDFGDSAALVNALDLVISVDTATVHLAGALGKDCWAMIPFVPDWRWLLGSETTPWYDSVKLFRQPELKDWDSVLNRISEELKAVVTV